MKVKGIWCCLYRAVNKLGNIVNNSIEQDYHFIKWRIQNRFGFESFESTR